MVELAEENLSRMLRDRWRVEAGHRLLDSRLRAGMYQGTVAAALMDLDGSGAVRAHGIEAKAQLVRQTHALVRELAPPDALIIDSGTRDETYVVLQEGDAARIVDLAERIRLAVRQHAFAISGIADAVHVTASVGCAVVPTTASGGAVFAYLREALATAKSHRDCVRLLSYGYEDAARPLAVDLPVSALEALDRFDADLDEVLRTGLWVLVEKHGPIWYWIGERAGASLGTIPVIDYVRQPDDAPPGAVDFFELLVWSVAFEAALTARIRRGYRPDLVAATTEPDGQKYDLVVPLLPGQWLASRSAAGSPPDIGGVFDAIQAARSGGRTATRTVTVHPWPAELAGLDRVSAVRGRSRPQLLAEALQLGVDHLAAWAFRRPSDAALDVF